jgi:hypothetical protein
MAEPAIYDVLLNAVDGYVHWINQFSTTSALDMFYVRLDSESLLTAARGRYRAEAQAVLDKASGRDHHKALRRFVLERDGGWEIAADPPLIVRIDGPEIDAMIDHALARYAETLSFDRRALFERFRFVDFARKVVGVGSVGTRCWIVLLRGWNGDPLFLQVKEAGVAAPTVALGRPPTGHEGQRVVEGQRALQSVSDILLGWTSDPRDGACYYVRQLWDDKGSVDLELITPRILRPYSRMCAGTLARAHARTGDAAFIAGYVGTSDRFTRAIADFAVAYADQAERDHAQLLTAIDDGTFALSANA